MSFDMLPPEDDSVRRDSSASVNLPPAAVAASWEKLAPSWQESAAAYDSVVSGLTGHAWSGPASDAMLAAAAPYLRWTKTNAAEARQLAERAHVAAESYEAAFATPPPPQVVSAYRNVLGALIVNFLNQNASATKLLTTYPTPTTRQLNSDVPLVLHELTAPLSIAPSASGLLEARPVRNPQPVTGSTTPMPSRTASSATGAGWPAPKRRPRVGLVRRWYGLRQAMRRRLR